MVKSSLVKLHIIFSLIVAVIVFIARKETGKK